MGRIGQPKKTKKIIKNIVRKRQIEPPNKPKNQL